MNPGAFSISLSVKDLEASRAFYGRLGFEIVAGSPEQNYLILRCGERVIGLFQGMFEGNVLTFNPGWDQEAHEVEGFTDIREIQRMLRQAGVEIMDGVDEQGSGPGSFMIVDPDGNPVLFDQHV